MVETTVNSPKHKMTRQEKNLIFATSIGTLLEWYDFFLFGLLANVMAKNFFSGYPPNIGFIISLTIFTIGFAARPFGAAIFGYLGDKFGRKYTFLMSVIIMGVSTFAIGILPTSAEIGIAAPILLIIIRILQGIAMGGEYGGAVTYVAEHAPIHRRGEYTSWILAIGTLGVFLALMVIAVTRYLLRDMGAEEALRDARFESWGWRVPFIVSSILLYISIVVRLKLKESPMYEDMKKAGTISKNPFKDATLRWVNLKFMIISFFALMFPMGFSIVTGQFYALQFLTQSLKLDPVFASISYAIAVAIAMPFQVISGMLSDRIGRKWILIVMTLITMSSYPFFFRALTHNVSPALESAMALSPITVYVDKNECHSQLNPLKAKEIPTSCDNAVNYLTANAIPFHYVYLKQGELSKIVIGAHEIYSYRILPDHEIQGMAGDINKTNKELFESQLKAAVKAANYPAEANNDQVNFVGTTIIMVLMAILGGMVAGVLPSAMVELFPTSIRYTGFSVPYHLSSVIINGVFPTVAFAIVTLTGNIYDGLWFPVICGIGGAIFAIFALKETRHQNLTKIGSSE